MNAQDYQKSGEKNSKPFTLNTNQLEKEEKQ